MSRRIELVLLLALFLLGGCARKAVPTKSTSGKVAPEVGASNVDFRYLTAKGKAQIEANGEKPPTVNITLRMRKDSIIWISASVSPIGEVGRVFITRDSVKLLNRLQKEYYSGNFSYLSKRFNVPVTFEQVQALLLGNYLPAAPGVTPAINTSGDLQTVHYEQVNLIIEQLIALSRARMQQLTVRDRETDNNFKVDYSDFRPLEATTQQFAYSVLVKAQQAKLPVSTVSINYRNVDVDKERLAFPFSVPSGYARKK
ncbi:DUF4292 domain-containing protein [Hymenobacter sp. BT491]|uniref:DUF4292 domain-containing protein n=1 Tax=Hymenobacter sp. BT491 TaxID=2766779 RepID=UPI0016539B0F|nr:DUF4292 domain-containing protein [Hymenobacter sp. BT491]MBC6990991.1 DUF4292 domain-containing protein [Hymenobacter sp. BT491]